MIFMPKWPILKMPALNLITNFRFQELETYAHFPARGMQDSNVGPAADKSLQSCPTLCDPIEGSLSGPAIPGILQARTLEWVAISSSNA